MARDWVMVMVSIFIKSIAILVVIVIDVAMNLIMTMISPENKLV